MFGRTFLQKFFPLKSIKFSFSISQKCGKISISSEISMKGLPQLLSPDEHFQLLFYGWRTKSFSSLDFEQKKWLFGRCFSAGSSKLQYTCPHEVFNEFCFMDFSFGHWAKVFNHVARFSRVLLKLHSEDKRRHLRKKLYFFEVSFFLPFPGLQRKDLGLLY